MPTAKEYLPVFLDMGDALLGSGAECVAQVSQHGFDPLQFFAVAPHFYPVELIAEVFVQPAEFCADGVLAVQCVI